MNRSRFLLAALSLAGLSAAHAQAPAQQPRAQQAHAQQAPTAEAVFAAWDTDKNRSLSLEEFRAGADRMLQATTLQRLKGNFDRIDRNRDGALDAGEYATLPVVRQGGGSTPSLAKTDADKDGRVEFKEYVAMVAALAKSPAAKL
jgi:Ca2+-binding EF-hand superfamily protein